VKQARRWIAKVNTSGVKAHVRRGKWQQHQALVFESYFDEVVLAAKVRIDDRADDAASEMYGGTDEQLFIGGLFERLQDVCGQFTRVGPNLSVHQRASYGAIPDAFEVDDQGAGDRLMRAQACLAQAADVEAPEIVERAFRCRRVEP